MQEILEHPSLTLHILLTNPMIPKNHIQHPASWSTLYSSRRPPLTFKHTHFWYLLVPSISLLPLL